MQRVARIAISLLGLISEGVRVARFGRAPFFPFDHALITILLHVFVCGWLLYTLHAERRALETKTAKKPVLDWVLGLATATASAIFLWQVVQAPTEQQMGVVQKIFYIHVPSAYAMYLGFGAAAAYGLAYFVWKKPWTDAYAVAGAELGLLFSGVVLITGPLWGRKAWGTYWTWDPRLTTTLMVAMIFASYVILRSSGEAGDAEKKFASALAVLGFALVPVVHYSVRLWSGQHPQVITRGGGGLDPRMVSPLVLGFVTVTLLFILLLRARARAEIIDQEVSSLLDDEDIRETEARIT